MIAIPAALCRFPRLLVVLLVAACVAGCGNAPVQAVGTTDLTTPIGEGPVKLFTGVNELVRAQDASDCPAGEAPAGAYRVADVSYAGEVCVRKRGEVFDVFWSLASGENYYGQGAVVRDQFVVGFNAQGEGYAFVMYELAGGKLSGSWSYAAVDTLGSEVIEGVPESLEGSFSVRGENPDGIAYTGNVDIRRQGQTFLLSWRVGDTAYQGVGVLQDGVLAVGWGNQEPGLGTISYKLGGPKLLGTWAFLRDTDTQGENLVPR